MNVSSHSLSHASMHTKRRHFTSPFLPSMPATAKTQLQAPPPHIYGYFTFQFFSYYSPTRLFFPNPAVLSPKSLNVPPYFLCRSPRALIFRT
jgi:hypothetical protein